MIRQVIAITGLAAMVGGGIGLYRTGKSHGRSECEAAALAAQAAQQVAIYGAAQISRQAAVDLIEAEHSLDIEIRRALDAIPEDDRQLCLSDSGRELLNSIRASSGN